MKISVILPSFLGFYDGCAAGDRKNLFKRAVNSFIAQIYPEEKRELIVISDGCPDTIEIIEKIYSHKLKSGVIKLIKLPRHEVFTGAVRQAGCEAATGEIIANLDSDDTILPNHLHNISVCFNPEETQWVYWNSITAPDELKHRNVEFYNDILPKLGSLNNGCIAWRRDLPVTWENCDGIHDNQAFIKQLLEKCPHYKKIFGCGYKIHHVKILKA